MFLNIVPYMKDVIGTDPTSGIETSTSQIHTEYYTTSLGIKWWYSNSIPQNPVISQTTFKEPTTTLS
jgi:hypothetical protein